MSRPRKPTSMLKLANAFQQNPPRGRARANEPEPQGEIGEPPAWFSLTEQAVWKEIVSVSHTGVFCRADRIALEIASQLLANYRAAPAVFSDARLLRLNQFLTCFGMTPSSRSLVSVSAAAQPNRFLSLKRWPAEVE